MTQDRRALYEQTILDHNRAPRNFRAMENATARARGFNALCGDQLTVYLKIEAGRIDDVSFMGSGCAISKSSASMMTEAVKGKPREVAEDLFVQFHRMVTAETDAPVPESLGTLEAFRGLREYPVRVKCATLPWHALMAALGGKGDTVSTE
jgi:nitrogen fixation NifU-like protein